MPEITKYILISTVIVGAYLLGYISWRMLKIKLGVPKALTVVGQISVWFIGIVLILLTVGSVIWYSIATVSHSISQVL